MYAIKAFVLFAAISTITCQKWPEWPWDFIYRPQGIAGLGSEWNCTKIDEPAMSAGDRFDDNYFCVKAGAGYRDIGMQFSALNAIPGKKCISLIDTSANIVWWDNHICFNNDVPYDIKWTYTGCLHDSACISWDDPDTPSRYTFWDDYLCASKYPADSTKSLTFTCSACGFKAGYFLIFAVAVALYLFA